MKGKKNILSLPDLSAEPVTPILNSARVRKTEASEHELKRLAQIYNIAARLFCERGYENTSMNDIAVAVGFTKAAIYHFVPGGKQDLLLAIINYGLDRYEKFVVEPAKAATDAEERLRLLITNHARLIASGSTPEGFNAVTIVTDEITGLSPQDRKQVIKRKRKSLDYLRNTLAQLKAEGKMKPRDVTVAAFSLLGMLLWLSRWYRSNGELTVDQVVEEITNLALDSVLIR